jgi:hypothetical protein
VRSFPFPLFEVINCFAQGFPGIHGVGFYYHTGMADCLTRYDASRYSRPSLSLFDLVASVFSN